MSEKIKTEHNEDVDFSPEPREMFEGMLSSADVEKPERQRTVKQFLGRFAIKTAEEWEDAEKLDEEQIAEIIASEQPGEGEDDADTEALEKAFGAPIERVEAAMGEDERVRVAAEALRLARNQSEGTYHSFIRDTAGIHGLLADDLLTATRVGVKEMMYDDERRKSAVFTTTVGEEAFARLITDGRLEREEDEGDPMASNLKFTEYQGTKTDEVELEELKPGEVRLFFGGDLVDDESFDCLLEKPTVDEIKIGACLGALAEGGWQTSTKWTKMLEKREIALPVHSDAWGSGALNLSFLQEVKAQEEKKYEEREQQRQLERGALTEVDEAKVTETAKRYAERISDETMDDLFILYQRSETPEAFREAETKAHEKICEALGLSETPELKYVDKPGTKEDSAFMAQIYTDEKSGKKILEINEHYRQMGDASASIEAIGHENFHALQDELAKRAEEDAEDLPKAERERATLYRWNKAHPVPAEVSIVRHLQQVTEREAWEFGAECRDGLFAAFERNRSAAKEKNAPAWLRNQAQAKARMEAMKAMRKGENDAA